MKIFARSHPAPAIYSTSSFIFLFVVVLLMVSTMCEADPSPLKYNSLFGGDKMNLNDNRLRFLGVRYGFPHVYDGKNHRQLNVVPPKNRFFLGSRFGKRSVTLTKEIETDKNNGTEQTYLACLHTGITNLYRCYGKENGRQFCDSLDSSNH